MKRVLPVILFLVTFMPGYVAADCTKLTITGHPEYAPIGWREGDRIIGAGAALVSQVATDLGLAVESKYTGSWADAQAATRDGSVDVIFGIYFNEERATYLDYVRPPFMIDPVVVMVRKGHAFPFSEWKDLVAKTGVTNEGESYGPEFDTFMAERLTVSRAKGTEATFRHLLDGKADYMIVGLYPGQTEAARLGVKDRVEALPQFLLSADMFIAFSKKSPCRHHRDAFGAKVETMAKDGTIETMLFNSVTEWESSLAVQTR